MGAPWGGLFVPFLVPDLCASVARAAGQERRKPGDRDTSHQRFVTSEGTRVTTLAANASGFRTVSMCNNHFLPSCWGCWLQGEAVDHPTCAEGCVPPPAISYIFLCIYIANLASVCTAFAEMMLLRPPPADPFRVAPHYTGHLWPPSDPLCISLPFTPPT